MYKNKQEEDLNKWKDTCAHGLEDWVLLRQQYFPIDLQIQQYSNQNPSCRFCRNRQADPNIHMEMQETRDPE